MAKVNVDKNMYFNNMTGEMELGWRDPNTHVVHFDDSAEVQEVVEVEPEDHGQVEVDNKVPETPEDSE
jgi:hypothetical protein